MQGEGRGVLKRNLITLGIIVLFIGAVVLVNIFEPSRVREQRIAEQEEVEGLLRTANEIEAMRPPQKMTLEAESTYTVEFGCSNGTFVVECYADWAPLGVARFKEAIEAGVYDEARFFRVIPGYVAQFGVPGDPKLAAEWREKTIVDDPVRQSNTKGTVTFAKSSAPNSRTTQIFINLGENWGPPSRLDTMGFAPIGRVISGMEVVEAINAEYSDRPNQSQIQMLGNEYLDENFPNLDFIFEATILSSKDTEED